MISLDKRTLKSDLLQTSYTTPKSVDGTLLIYTGADKGWIDNHSLTGNTPISPTISSFDWTFSKASLMGPASGSS